MRFSELVNHTNALSIEYRGSTLNFKYFTEKLTPAYKEKLAQMSGEEADQQAEAFLLSVLVESWDVLDDTDQPIPVTYEFLCGCSYAFLTAMVKAIYADLANPTSASAETSPAS